MISINKNMKKEKEIEIWKVLHSNKNYLISDWGRVRVLPRLSKDGRKLKGKMLNPYLNVDGYFVVNIGGKPKTVHQLVAEVFLNHIPCGLKIVVDHINNVPTDNRLINLQLTSHRENSSKDKKGGSSKHVGVNWNKPTKKWMSSIYINGKRKYLGLFNCELEAAEEYQKSLKKLIK